MTKAAATAGDATELDLRVGAARRLLHIDPTTALRTLDPVVSAQPTSQADGAYEDALALRVIASSMLGLLPEAAQGARNLAAFRKGGRGQIAVASWLLTYSGDGAKLVAPLAHGGCGRSGCGHDPAVELALQTIRESEAPERRREVATQFAAIRPDLSAFKLAQAKALRDAGEVDDAIAFLRSMDDARMRRAAGIMLYDAGRFDEARPFLIGSADLQEAANLGALLKVGVVKGAPVPAAFAISPVLRAIHLEASGRWPEAAQAWSDASRPLEAWEASLVAGIPGEPADGANPRWAWRYFALTGERRPPGVPDRPALTRYAAIGRARQLTAQVRAGERPRMHEGEDDLFELEGALELVVRVHGDAVEAASRLVAIDIPRRPADLLHGLCALPGGVDWLVSRDRREAWRDWSVEHPAPQIPGPKIAQRALLSRLLAGNLPPDPKQVAAHLEGLPSAEAATAVGIMIAKGWDLGHQMVGSLVEPAVIATCLDGGRADLLSVMAIIAGSSGLPDNLRRVAGEIGGSLVALAQSRGEVSAGGGRKAARVIEDALSEVPPIAGILSPVSAYEQELGWLGGKSSVVAGPILASRAGLAAMSVKAPRGKPSRMYGTFGRVRILAEAGQLESALQAAIEVGVDDESIQNERDEVLAELRAELAIRRADVGDIAQAVALAVESRPAGSGAATRVARAILDRLDEHGRDEAITYLETLHKAYPSVAGVSVSLAKLLNQRAVSRQREDRPVSTYLSDLERAAKLDPDSIQIRSNLAQTYFGRASERWERYPDQAVADLRLAISTDPNESDIQEAGARLAVLCGSAFAKRGDRYRALQCIEYALKLDPMNEVAHRAAMALR